MLFSKQRPHDERDGRLLNVWKQKTERESLVWMKFLLRTLFSSNACARQVNWELEMRTIHPKVTHEMNSKLVEPYIDEEIRKALFQMISEKARDGFRQYFIKDSRRW